ncbi:MAG: FHA domain-containing protein [Bacteroidales bacterium]|jgi:hypothetical protein|nr:FHA domain-containing protein [Bacteroidales bacterium]
MKVITIGRSSSNDIVINDAKVSRRHMQIIQDDHGNFLLSDLESKNGTYINGVKIKGREVRLSSYDIIKIGNTVVPWKSYFPPTGGYPPPPPPPEPKSSNTGILVLILGLAALGCVAFIIINYFISFGNQIALTFGGTEASLKLFPIYLRGYFGIGGQWIPMIAALVLGSIADFVDYTNENTEDKLSSAGQWMANIAISVSVIFLLLAIFAEHIVNLY